MAKRLVQIGLLIVSASAFGHQAAAQSLEGWKVEGGLYGGAILAHKEIGRDRNRTGGEQLIAALPGGALAGTRFGIHGALVGFDANVLSGSRAVKVANEIGVAFPNHGKTPTLISGDVLVYPLGNYLIAGAVRPYLTTGAGVTVISVDLDNIDDQQTTGLFTWNVGGGLKLLFGEKRDTYLDIQFKNHRVAGSNEFRVFTLRSFSVGIGHRF